MIDAFRAEDNAMSAPCTVTAIADFEPTGNPLLDHLRRTQAALLPGDAALQALSDMASSAGESWS